MSFPRRLRLALALDAALTTRVLAITLRAIFAWQRRRARRLGWRVSRTGAVTFIQRFSSALRLNVHFHCLVPDGVFAAEWPVMGGSSFLTLPPPRDEEVGAINRRIARKTLLLFRSIDPSERRIDDNALERLYAAALQPLPPHFHLRASRPRCSSIEGFSLHANVRVAADNRGRLERVCRYGLRPPLSHERLERLPSGNLVSRMKRLGPDGATHRVMSPLEFLSALASLVPPPRVHLTRYHGVFAPHAPDRGTVRHATDPTQVGAQRPDTAVDSPSSNGPLPTTSSDVPSSSCGGSPARVAYRRRWAELLKKVFAIDIFLCDRCGARRRIVAAITQADVAHAFLRCLGPRGIRDPARAPPKTAGA